MNCRKVHFNFCSWLHTSSITSLISSHISLLVHSAGKSTFFNAATCAALRSGDGRKMADVAPHPFTTIGEMRCDATLCGVI